MINKNVIVNTNTFYALIARHFEKVIITKIKKSLK